MLGICKQHRIADSKAEKDKTGCISGKDFSYFLHDRASVEDPGGLIVSERLQKIAAPNLC